MESAIRLKTIHRHLSGGNFKNLDEIWSEPETEMDKYKFQYTLPNNLLSEKQLQFYDDNGYLVISKLIPDDILDRCMQRFLDICSGTVPVGGMTLMKDISLAKTGVTGEYLYNKVQNIAFDDVFPICMTYPPLLDYVECFTGKNIMAVHSMLVNKPPDAGTLSSTHPLHQDLYYFPFRPANRIVAMWCAMEPITVRNGCLIVLPGTHKGALREHDYPKWQGDEVNKLYHGITGFDSHPYVNLPMQKGDTVFFHPLLIHGSGPNLTTGFRKAISFHYAASECEYIDVRGTVQEKIGREIEEVVLKSGKQIDFCTVYRFKSRLVRGKAINL